MKLKLLFVNIAAIAVISFFAFGPLQERDPNSLAEAQMIDGVYCFYMSSPIQEYEVLGNVDCPTIILDNKPTTRRDALLKKFHKKFSYADGVIFSGDMCDAQAIRFVKE